MNRPNPAKVLFLGLDDEEQVCKIKVDTSNELLARILVAAARITKRENQLRRTTRDFRS